MSGEGERRAADHRRVGEPSETAGATTEGTPDPAVRGARTIPPTTTAVDLGAWETSGWEARGPVAAPRPTRRWAFVTMALLLAAAVVWTAGILLVDLAGYDLIAAAETGTLRLGAEEEWIERAETIGRLSVGLNVLIGIFFLAWLYRTVINVPRLGGGPTARSAAGAVGWWFVPIANLFVPYQVVADADRRIARSLGLAWTRWMVLGWWLAWIFGGLLSRVLLLTRQSPVPTFQQVREALEIGLYADVLVLVAAVLLLRIVWRNQARQDARIRQMAATPDSIGGRATARAG